MTHFEKVDVEAQNICTGDRFKVGLELKVIQRVTDAPGEEGGIRFSWGTGRYDHEDRAKDTQVTIYRAWRRWQ